MVALYPRPLIGGGSRTISLTRRRGPDDAPRAHRAAGLGSAGPGVGFRGRARSSRPPAAEARAVAASARALAVRRRREAESLPDGHEHAEIDGARGGEADAAGGATGPRPGPLWRRLRGGRS